MMLLAMTNDQMRERRLAEQVAEKDRLRQIDAARARISSARRRLENTAIEVAHEIEAGRAELAALGIRDAI